MVCLTSCVFRSIRFSGFARPLRLGCGAREYYTRTRRQGASVEPRLHRMDTNWGRIIDWARFRPGGARGLLRPAPPLPPPPVSNGPLAAYGPPPLRESGPRMSCIYSGSRLCSTDRRHKRPRASQGHPLSNAASRNLSSYHGQTVARPIQRASLPAALRPSGLPRRHRKARAPRRPWDAGSKSGCRFVSVLLLCSLAAGDVGLDAQHDAHGEDAGDCRDTGGRRVQRDLPTLSVPRLCPFRIHKVVLLRPRFQSSAQCQARFPVIQHRNRPIPQTPAAAIAPFVHWDIRAQTAGIYLPIH